MNRNTSLTGFGILCLLAALLLPSTTTAQAKLDPKDERIYTRLIKLCDKVRTLTGHGEDCPSKEETMRVHYTNGRFKDTPVEMIGTNCKRTTYKYKEIRCSYADLHQAIEGEDIENENKGFLRGPKGLTKPSEMDSFALELFETWYAEQILQQKGINLDNTKPLGPAFRLKMRSKAEKPAETQLIQISPKDVVVFDFVPAVPAFLEGSSVYVVGDPTFQPFSTEELDRMQETAASLDYPVYVVVMQKGPSESTASEFLWKVSLEWHISVESSILLLSSNPRIERLRAGYLCNGFGEYGRKLETQRNLSRVQDQAKIGNPVREVIHLMERLGKSRRCNK